MDGIFTEKTFLEHTDGIGPKDLTNFTLCMRFNINFLRGPFTHPFSYASNADDNAIIVWFEKKTNNLLAPIELATCKYPYVSNREAECNFYPIGLKPHHQWHHFCFILTSHEFDHGNMESDMSLIFDMQARL